jgi:hypothetical protein
VNEQQMKAKVVPSLIALEHEVNAELGPSPRA